MKDKKYKVFLIIIALLVVISGALVAFNALVLKTEPIQYKTYYRANQNINSYTKLTTNMFDPVSVPDTMVMDGMISNIADVVNKYNSTFITKGEYLVTDKLTSDNGEAGLIYSIPITAAYVSDVAYDDYVDIYGIDGNYNITLMYGGKKIYRAKTAAINTENQTNGYESAATMYLHVTKDEMLKYYNSLRDTKLIVLSYNEGVTTDMVNAIADSIMEKDNEEVNTIVDTFEYVAIEGDTLESISEDFQVDINDIRLLNPGVTSVKPNDVIKIPA